jgi:hypothetical protein
VEKIALAVIMLAAPTSNKADEEILQIFIIF